MLLSRVKFIVGSTSGHGERFEHIVADIKNLPHPYPYSIDPEILGTLNENIASLPALVNSAQALRETVDVQLNTIEKQARDIARLRRMLCIAYAGSKFYGDDGELQDNREFPCIDFKRDSVDDIDRKMHDRAHKRLNEFMQSLHNAHKNESTNKEKNQ